jgi:hypothetical protein
VAVTILVALMLEFLVGCFYFCRQMRKLWIGADPIGSAAAALYYAATAILVAKAFQWLLALHTHYDLSAMATSVGF